MRGFLGALLALGVCAGAFGQTAPVGPVSTPGPVFNVQTECHATGMGTVDDTFAIQNCISQAEAFLSTTNYWSQSALPAVYFPPGNYLITGIDVHYAIKFYGDGANAVNFILKAGANRSVIRSIAEPQTDPAPWAQSAQPNFSGFSINGNSSNETGTSYGIEIADASYAQGTRYGSGAWIRDINVFGTLNHGIYIGSNRNLGAIDRVLVNYALNSCIYFANSNDWTITNSSLGACTYNGVEIYSSGQISLATDAVYNNGSDGIKVDPGFGGYLLISGSTIGGNNGNGLNITPQSGTEATSMIAVVGTQFTDNSLATNNSSSHIYIRSYPFLTVTNCSFSYQGTGNNTKYIIDNDSSIVGVSSLTYYPTGANTPFVTAAFGTPTSINGPTNSSVGTFSLNVPFLAPSITTPTISTATSQLNLNTQYGNQFQINDQGSASVNFGYAKGSPSAGPVLFGAYGTDTNVNASFSMKGTGTFSVNNSEGNMFTAATSGVTFAEPILIPSLPTGTAATYACFTSSGKLISSTVAC